MKAAHLGSTYRLQLNGRGFVKARALVSYLADLGIETLYVSPIVAAGTGSTHGYDVIDPTRLDPALGTPEEFEDLLATLDEHDMRLLIDIVPNHMACTSENHWWWDVLRRGSESESATVFDIDWTKHGGRVLVPTLPTPLSDALDHVGVSERGGERVLEIAGQRFPLSPGSRARSETATLLERQHYRLGYWRLSNEEGNYRRFFDIDGLIGVRVEDVDVFDRTHELIRVLAPDERIVGWRVDHVDGLTDPAVYLDRLATLVNEGRRVRPAVLVEKILARDEELVARWRTDGTTGYEFANVVGGLFVDPGGAQLLEARSMELTGDRRTFKEMGTAAKAEVISSSFAGSLDRLVQLALRSLDATHPGHDLAPHHVGRAIAALTIHLDVYRTYVSATRRDAENAARTDRPIRDADADLDAESRRAIGLIRELIIDPGVAELEFVQRWQQFSGAVMAKGVEDTATYRFAGLLSHAEVGGDPGQPSTTVTEFYRFIEDRVPRPLSMNATSTHDSKRSEDARARLFVLSEVAEEWSRLVGRWHRRYATLRSPAGPDVPRELAFYQSAVCLWPVDGGTPTRTLRRRLQEYVIKAAREEKRRTTWTDPNDLYERALRSYVNAVMLDEAFQREMNSFMRHIGPAAATNSLAMVVVKCVAPGVPDFYQGSELWDYSLTDPDNRRPVDYARRRSTLERVAEAFAADGTGQLAPRLATWQDGAVKLHVTRSLLSLRRRHRALFANGSFEPLTVAGPLADHVVAFARRRGNDWAFAVVPRQVVSVAGAGRFATESSEWSNTTIRLASGAPTELLNALTGEGVVARRGRLAVGECFRDLPVAVLTAR